MAKVVFHHSSIVNDLELDVNPDAVTWSYQLNTQNYPTYGGEVVQILSMFVNDMTITGTVSNYAKMEYIYEWFVAYMQQATQGKNASYDTTPVTFFYPARGWKFLIMPKSVPGFKYGKDVVAPTWSITAAVVESPENFRQSLKSSVEYKAMEGDEGFQPFGTATARIGFNEFNPWSAPNTGKPYKKGATKEYYAQLSGVNGPFNSFMHAWIGDGQTDMTAAEAIGTTYSKPAFNNGSNGNADPSGPATGTTPNPGGG
jgi:hypothetical protein